MFRTVYVARGEAITVVDNWLLIKSEHGEESKVPVDDIYTLFLENVHTRISVYALQYLSNSGVNIVCASFTTAIDSADVNKLLIPKIIVNG